NTSDTRTTPASPPNARSTSASRNKKLALISTGNPNAVPSRHDLNMRSTCTRCAHASPTRKTRLDELGDAARELFAVLACDPRNRDLVEVGSMSIGKADQVAGDADQCPR